MNTEQAVKKKKQNKKTNNEHAKAHVLVSLCLKIPPLWSRKTGCVHSFLCDQHSQFPFPHRVESIYDLLFASIRLIQKHTKKKHTKKNKENSYSRLMRVDKRRFPILGIL